MNTEQFRTPRWLLLIIGVLCAFLVGAGLYLNSYPIRQNGPIEKMTIATNGIYLGSALVLIADENGYFTDAGLDVKLQPQYTNGAAALQATLDGTADLATTAETPIMYAVMHKYALSIVATICMSDQDLAIIARKNRGIDEPANLRGKRVGVTLATTSHYFLDALLINSRVPIDQLQLVNLTPEQLSNAVRDDQVDAVSSWEPISTQIAARLGDQAKIFLADGAYVQTYSLVGRMDYVKQHPHSMEQVLRALTRAETFINDHPAEAGALIAHRLQLDPAEVARLWPKYKFKLLLDQGLISTLEAQAQWAMNNGFVNRAEIPNFFNNIYMDAMAEVFPSRLMVIH